MNFENILYEIEDGILYLTLNRPEVRNALTPAMWRDIQSAVGLAKADDRVRVVIITGAGDKALASGADIQEIHDRETLKMLEGTSTIALKELEDLYKPVICAVNGYALGGGLELALACDLRVAAKTAKLGLPEVGLGLIPGFGGTQRLPRLIGRGRALDLIFTGRHVDAEEALFLGLVNRVAEDALEEAKKLAQKILKNAPIALALAKESVVRGEGLDLAEALEIEADLFGYAAATEDMKEGVRAFLEKRPPSFKGE